MLCLQPVLPQGGQQRTLRKPRNSIFCPLCVCWNQAIYPVILGYIHVSLIYPSLPPIWKLCTTARYKSRTFISHPSMPVWHSAVHHCTSCQYSWLKRQCTVQHAHSSKRPGSE